MSVLANEINKELGEAGIEPEQFSELIAVLMENGVICGDEDESDTERTLYARFEKCEALVSDYLDIMGISVRHNKRFASVRVYAPYADHPHNMYVYNDQPSSQMRMAIGGDLSAALLVSFLLYRQHATEGRLKEDFSAVVSREEFYTAHAVNLSYTPAKHKSAQVDVMKTLQRLRVIRIHKDFFDNPEYQIVIRPLIDDIVLEESIAAAISVAKQTDIPEEVETIDED